MKDSPEQKTVGRTIGKAFLAFLNAVSLLCAVAVAILILRDSGLDLSDDWLRWSGIVGTITWTGYLVLRPPRRYALPEFMTRIDAAYLDDEGSKVVDYWRAAVWLIIWLFNLVALLWERR